MIGKNRINYIKRRTSINQQEKTEININHDDNLVNKNKLLESQNYNNDFILFIS